jgi:hypothetical protein
MKTQAFIFWIVCLGLLALGGLGYAERIWGFSVEYPRLLLLVFIILTLADRAWTYYLQSKAYTHARQFRIFESYAIAHGGDDLKGLAWDGNLFWFTGRVDNVQGIFRLNREFAIDQSIRIPESFPYAIIARDDLVVLTATPERYEVREYTTSGTLTNVKPIPIELHGMPACFAFDGSQYWLAVDEASIIYVISSSFAVLQQQPLTHRVLGATYARDHLWLTDAYKLYQYDRDLNLRETYDYPGTTCRGIVFDSTNLWSLDDGPKRLHRHLVL